MIRVINYNGFKTESKRFDKYSEALEYKREFGGKICIKVNNLK